MSTSTLLTRAEYIEYLRGLNRSDLEALAQELGLVIGGSGKDGSVTKKDLVESVGVRLVSKPTHYRVINNDVQYHNGMLPDKLGCEWREGEVRVLPVWVLAQVASDVGEDRARERFEVLDKLYTVEKEN